MAQEKVTARALGSEGQGIADLNSGKVVFVEGLLPGETALVDIYEEKSKISYASIIKRDNDSPSRVEPLCPNFGKCGGCSLMHMDRDLQLEFKSSKVRDVLIRIGRFDESLIDGVFEKICDGKDPLHYRNHMQYRISGQKIGFKARKSNEFVPCDDCLLEYEQIAAIRRSIEDVFKDHPTDMFSALTIRGSRRTNEFLAEFVCESGRPHELLIRDAQKYIDSADLMNRLDFIKGILLRISPDKASQRQRSGKRVVLQGVDHYHEILNGKKFRVKAGAFFQVNTEQAERLYDQVKTHARGSRILYDLFCGTGSIGICCADEDTRLFGIEVSKEAVDSAKVNAELNNMRNAEFVAKPAERFDFDDLPVPDAIIVDPPRKGMDIALINKLKRIAPQKIIYVSCDPGTLARDLKYLCSDYEIRSVRPFELFSWSEHVETVVQLSRK